jgi:hypothetical protein
MRGELTDIQGTPSQRIRDDEQNDVGKVHKTACARDAFQKPLPAFVRNYVCE